MPVYYLQWLAIFLDTERIIANGACAAVDSTSQLSAAVLAEHEQCTTLLLLAWCACRRVVVQVHSQDHPRKKENERATLIEKPAPQPRTRNASRLGARLAFSAKPQSLSILKVAAALRNPIILHSYYGAL